jgi:uncharacterized membrane protein
MHINAFWCIFIIFIAFHPNAFFTCCMVLHIIAFIRIHVWCILILMHLLTFIRMFNAAFGTRCIHVHLNASYFGCIFLAVAFSCIHCTRCIHVHSLYVAFYICRIYNAFQYILSLVHFECAAFYLWCIQMQYRCIVMYSSALRRKNTRFRWAPGRDLTRFMMLKNAHEC